MSRSLLKSSTTLAIALSLLQPVVAFAQNAVIVECVPGALGVSVPCLDPLTKEPRIPAPRTAGDEAAYAASAEVEVKVAIAMLETARTVAAAAALDVSLAAAVAAEAKPEDTVAAAAALIMAETAAVAADQLVTEAEATVAATETNAEIAALEATEAAALAEAEAARVADAEADAAVLAEAEAAKADAETTALTAELEAAKALKADTEAAEATALKSELELAEAAASAAEAEAGRTSAAETNAVATTEAAAVIDTDTAGLAAALACDPLAPGVVCDIPVGANDTPRNNMPEVPTVAPESEAAAAANTAPAESDVVTQILTEDDTRSSTQEFVNNVGAGANVDDGGLSNLEKAGLLLLGAVVVGTIINNNEKVVANSGDRVVTQDEDGSYRVYKDDNTLLMRPGATVRSQTFSDGSTRSYVLREDGTEIVTIRDADGRVLRRIHVGQDGLETMLFDDTRTVEIVDLRELPRREVADFNYSDTADRNALRQAFLATAPQPVGRNFSLRQIREIREVRDLAVEITLSAITFETASAAIRPAQAERLQHLGVLMAELIEEDPRELFLIEGHTDAIGDAASNLALSDRRAETVALALAEYFDVPPENLVIQGYGERFLKISTQEAELRNRRVGVRRITGLLN